MGRWEWQILKSVVETSRPSTLCALFFATHPLDIRIYVQQVVNSTNVLPGQRTQYRRGSGPLYGLFRWVELTKDRVFFHQLIYGVQGAFTIKQ